MWKQSMTPKELKNTWHLKTKLRRISELIFYVLIVHHYESCLRLLRIHYSCDVKKLWRFYIFTLWRFFEMYFWSNISLFENFKTVLNYTCKYLNIMYFYPCFNISIFAFLVPLSVISLRIKFETFINDANSVGAQAGFA